MNFKRLAIPVLVVGALAVGFQLSSTLLDRARDNHSLMVSGNIEAHQSVLSFKAVQSRIVELAVEEGQWVRKGAVLARLDDSDYHQQVVRDESVLRVQEAQLALVLAGSRPQDIEAARQTVLNDRAELEQKKIDFERAQRLFLQGVIPPADRDLAETALKRAQAGYLRDKRLYEKALEGSRKEDVAIAQANVRHAREALEMSRILLGYTVLQAPISGVILTRQAELGEVVSPGTPVMTLADLDHIWMRAYISETDLGRIRWGQSAVLHTDTYPAKNYQGRVSFIASQAEFTPKSVETHKERVTLVYRIKIDVDNPNHELKPGMPADATIDFTPSQGPTQPQSNGRIGQRD